MGSNGTNVGSRILPALSSLWNHSNGKISGLFAWKSSPLNRLKSPSSISSLTTSENLASSHSRTPIGIILPQLIFDITHFFNVEICGNWNKVAWIIWKEKLYAYCPFWAFLANFWVIFNFLKEGLDARLLSRSLRQRSDKPLVGHYCGGRVWSICLPFIFTLYLDLLFFVFYICICILQLLLL